MRIIRSALMLILIALCHAPLGSSASDAGAFQMEGVAGFIEGRARGQLKAELDRAGPDWIADAMSVALGGRNAKEMPRFFAEDPALKIAVREEIKKRIKEWLPGQVRDLVWRDILGSVMEKEAALEARAIADRVMKELDTSLNDKLDEMAGRMYDGTVAELERALAELGAGKVLDPTDVKGSIRRAFELGRVGDAMAAGLGQEIGDATVAGIRGRISDALGGRLPPELVHALQRGPEEFDKYVAKAKEHLPGSGLRKLTGSLLNRPVIKIPTPAYVALLAASSAGHFAQAYKGLVVDVHELKRGIEVTRVMVWQVKNKEWINLSIMQLAGLARGIAQRFGAGGAFEGLVDKIRAPVDRIQKIADNIDKMLLKPVDQVRTELKDIVGQMQSELVRLQNDLTGPIRAAADEAREGLKEAGLSIAEEIPEEINGIPPSWEVLKERAGFGGGILGEAGQWRPRDAIEGPLNKIKKDFEKVNDAVAGKLAEGAADALEALHLLGPAAKILDVEKVPAQNESKSEELDPVLLHNGEFVHSVTDVVIPGRGPARHASLRLGGEAGGLDFRFTRTYRGHGKFLGELGFCWTHSYAERLLPWNDKTGDGMTYIDEEGRKFFFRKGDDGFIAPEGHYLKLLKFGEGEFEISRKNGPKKVFDANGKLSEIRDEYGNRMALIYNEAGLLDSVLDPYGRRVSIERRKDGLISRLTDFAGRSFFYEYNDAQELVKVTSPATPDFPKGKSTAYRYTRVGEGSASAHTISMIMDPKGEVYLKNRYDDSGRVIAQSYGDSPWMTVAYSAQDAKADGGVASRAWVRDARGITRLYEHDGEGRLLRKWRYEGPHYALIISHQYDGAGNRTSTCLPSGRCACFKYGEEEDAGGIIGAEILPAGGGRPRAVDLVKGEGEGARAYNECGQVVEETDARGVVTAYEYYPSSDPDGDGVNISGQNENGMRCGYLRKIVEDARDSPQRAAEGQPIRRSTEFTYDPIGNIVSEIGPDGAAASLKVNALNQVTGERRPGLLPITYSFDANDNTIGVVIGDGENKMIQEFKYGPIDRQTSRSERLSDKSSIETRYEYDSEGLLTRIVHPEGNADDYEYDAEGRIACIIRGSNSLERSHECVERNADGEVVASIDGEGMRTTFTRDGFGDVVERIDPLKNRTNYGRDEMGRVVSERAFDAGGKLLSETSFTYDSDGRVVSRKGRLWREDPKKSSWVEERMEYDAADNVVAVISPSGGRTELRRDGAGDVVMEIRSAGARRMYVRDASGRVVESFVDAGGERLFPMRFEYDEAGRITAVMAGEERWSYGYDGLGNLTSIVNPSGTEVRREIDGIGRVTAAIRDARGLKVRTEYGWNGNGQLISISDPDGKTTRFAYDSLDRLIVERSANGAERRTAYDRRGLVTSSIDGNGSILSVEYDQAGRIRSRRAISARGVIGTSEQRFEYDGLGRITGAFDDDNATRHVFDSLSRLVAESQNGNWITREFDVEGDVVAMIFPSGEKVFSARDVEGKITALMNARGSLATFNYDPAGRMIGQRLGAFNLAIRRDAFGREFDRRYEIGGNEWIAGEEIHWDSGRVAFTKGFAGLTRTYGRDSLGRLKFAEDSYAHDDSGDGEDGMPLPKTWRYEYDASGNLRDADETQMSYDANGNLISDGEWQYRYDIFNRLSGVWKEGGAKASYRYDAFGRRVQKDVGGKIEKGIWDGWRLIEVQEDGKVVADYIYDDNSFAPLMAISQVNNDYFMSDHMDSVIGYADQDGILKARCDYEPFGEEITEECKSISHPFRFAGGIVDKESALIYMRNRYYSPPLGKFISPDPIGFKVTHKTSGAMDLSESPSYHAAQGKAQRITFPNRPLHVGAGNLAYPFARAVITGRFGFEEGEPNLYIYARNDPSTFTDPLGLASLLFDRSDGMMYLYGGDERLRRAFLASNNATSPNANPYQLGGHGPFPGGTWQIDAPEFYSQEYRDAVYHKIGIDSQAPGDITTGESYVTGKNWLKHPDDTDDYSTRYGRIRMRAGWRGQYGSDLIWDRGLFIHGGRHNYRSKTWGCIRMDDAELEELASESIFLGRHGDIVRTITVQD